MMKIKHLLIRTLMVMLVACSVMLCGFAVSAAAAEPLPELTTVTENAPALTTADITLSQDTDTTVGSLSGEDGYTIELTDTSSGSKKSVNWLKIILISVGISLVITIIVVLVIYNGYKSNGQTEPYEFKNKAPLDLKETEDILVDVSVTSVHINRDNH